jgi:uncharacterized membrane protein (DUF4010 family)
MYPPMNTPLRVALLVLLVTLVSFIGSPFLVETSWFWKLNSSLHPSLKTLGVGAAQFILTPVRPVEVHDQEGQLELFLAWQFLVLVASLSLLGLAAVRRLRRKASARDI